MAPKKTYVYRVMLGYNGKVCEDVFMYARNSDVAKEFCRNEFKDKKYNFFLANKVGLSHTVRDTEIIQGYYADKLKNSIAGQDQKFSEREVAMPEFVSAKEVEET